MKQGQKHEYLAMVLGFSDPLKVKVDMTEYLASILEDVSGKYNGEATTPVTSHLFEVKVECEKLNLQAATAFHHVVAQLLLAVPISRQP